MKYSLISISVYFYQNEPLLFYPSFKLEVLDIFLSTENILSDCLNVPFDAQTLVSSVEVATVKYKSFHK